MYRYRVLARLILLASTLLMVACVKTCVGLGELGSKERPFTFALEGWSASGDSESEFRKIMSCMESVSGYRVAFEIYADSSAVVKSLLSKQAQLGFFDSTSFISEGLAQGLEPVFSVGKRSDVEKRSVLFAKHSESTRYLRSTNLHLSQDSWALSLQQADKETVAYLSQSSAEGFLVPRHMLLQAGVLPAGAIFAGSWEIIEELVREGQAVMGVLSDSYVYENWGVEEIEVGLTHEGLVMLAISPPFPKKVLVSERDFSQKILGAIMTGLRKCGAESATESIESTFTGLEFEKVNVQDFSFLKEIIDFQRTFVRVLPENKETHSKTAL